MRKTCIFAAVALVVAAAGPGTAQGQTVYQPQIVNDGPVGGDFLVTPADVRLVGLDGSPFPPRPMVGGPTASPTTDGVVRGLNGGIPVGNKVTASIGFTYLVPLWSFRAFELAAPEGYKQYFPVFGRTGPVDANFGYAPRINLDYYIQDVDLGVAASGTFVNLSGRIDRQQAGTTGGNAQLTASSTVTLVSANLLEFHRLFAFEGLFPNKELRHQNVADSVLDLRIGTRYVALDQNYNGTLLGGGNVTTRFSTESYRGIGITLGQIWTIPLGDDWATFMSLRESVLIGDSRRNSSVTATVTGLPTLTATQLETRTQLVPVGELESGVDWGRDLGTRLRDGRGPPQFSIRVSGVAQYWGGLGPLSAASTQGFRTTDLFVIGAYVNAGFHY